MNFDVLGVGYFPLKLITAIYPSFLQQFFFMWLLAILYHKHPEDECSENELLPSSHIHTADRTNQVNVNKIICRYTQGNNQKEVLSGQKMIGSIFLEISVW